MMWGYGFGWGGMLLMLLGTLLFLALLAVLIWAVVRLVAGKTTTPVPSYRRSEPTGPSALEILGQRYAHGEIDATTYEQMRARLETPRTQSPAGRV
jgi:putative membrane protein